MRKTIWDHANAEKDEDQMRRLSWKEWSDIMEMYEAPEGHPEGLEEAGHQRNVARHVTRLGLLIVAALSGGGGIDPHSLFSLAVQGAGWTYEDVEEFLDRDSNGENIEAARIMHMMRFEA